MSQASLAERARRAYLTSMAGHDHHESGGEELTRAAQARLEQSGEQWTRMRESVFTALAGFKRPASAYDIAEAVSLAQDRRVAANSVYRILDLFVGNNLARRVESENAYVANTHPNCRHDCIFLVCDGCGTTTHIDNDRITVAVRSAASDSGFTPERPVIEVRGRCAACSGAATN